MTTTVNIKDSKVIQSVCDSINRSLPELGFDAEIVKPQVENISEILLKGFKDLFYADQASGQRMNPPVKSAEYSSAYYALDRIRFLPDLPETPKNPEWKPGLYQETLSILKDVWEGISQEYKEMLKTPSTLDGADRHNTPQELIRGAKSEMEVKGVQAKNAVPHHILYELFVYPVDPIENDTYRKWSDLPVEVRPDLQMVVPTRSPTALIITDGTPQPAIAEVGNKR
ncbi:MAG TPA: hypothetical protein DIV86_03055 [Alphaproteobacteria bacterium]|nr:hypothetical protein [Alphaproteobacteria bacterium]